jgi:outer membrane protein TolC
MPGIDLGVHVSRQWRRITRCVRWIAIPSLFVLTGPAASAQPAAPLPLTLEEAQARAVEVSHRLAESRARAGAAQAAIYARLAAELPVVSVSAGYTRTNHVTEFVLPSATGVPRVLYPDAPDNYRTRIDLQWPIYTGGRTDALERAARAEAGAVSAEMAVVRADLRLEVARAFWAVVTARATVSVLEQGVSRAQAHVRDVRERFNAGLVPPNEVASAEAQESRQRMLLIEARGQREVAAAGLARLVADDPDQPIEPNAVLALGPAATRDTAAALASARVARSERVVLGRRIDVAVEHEVAAAAGRLPVVAVGGGIDYGRPNPRIFPRAERWDESWDAGLNVTWSLWDGGRVRAEVAQAASLAEAARHRLAEFDSALAVEIRQRTVELESARAAVVAAEDAVRAATEAQRVVTERYRAGVIGQIEVLDAEFALLQAELDRTRGLANVRLSEARLARALEQ